MKILPVETTHVYWVIYNTDVNMFISVLGHNVADAKDANRFLSFESAYSRRIRISPFNHIILKVQAHLKFEEV